MSKPLCFFCKWLEKHDLTYSIEGAAEDPRVYVTYPDGWYIRISDFTVSYQCYVRDNGLCDTYNIFDVCDRILEQKGRSDENIKNGAPKRDAQPADLAILKMFKEGMK